MPQINYTQAEFYSYLSMQAYTDGGGLAPPGWRVLLTSDQAGLDLGANGYYGVAYQNIANPSQIVIASRGTEPSDLSDLLADGSIPFGSITSQFDAAKTFTLSVALEAGISASSIYQTGHSLGGDLASLLSITFGSQSSIYNAPGEAGQLAALETYNGVAAGTYQNSNYSNSITAYDLSSDLVHLYGTQVGTAINIPDPLAADQSTVELALDRDFLFFPSLSLTTPQSAISLAIQEHGIAYTDSVLNDMALNEQITPNQTPLLQWQDYVTQIAQSSNTTPSQVFNFMVQENEASSNNFNYNASLNNLYSFARESGWINTDGSTNLYGFLNQSDNQSFLNYALNTAGAAPGNSLTLDTPQQEAQIAAGQIDPTQTTFVQAAPLAAADPGAAILNNIMKYQDPNSTIEQISANNDGTYSMIELDTDGHYVTKNFTLDADNNITSMVRDDHFYDTNSVVDQTTQFDTSGNVIGIPTISITTDNVTKNAASIGSQLGSTLGNSLAGNNMFAQVGASTLGALIGKDAFSLAGSLSTSLLGMEPSINAQLAGQTQLQYATNQAINSFTSEAGVSNFMGCLGQNGFTALSSLITGEAAQSLGLTGFEDTAFTDGAATISKQLATNLGGMISDEIQGQSVSASDLFSGFNVAKLVSSFGVMAGTQLGDELASQILGTPANTAQAMAESLGGLAGSAFVESAVAEALSSCVVDAGIITTATTAAAEVLGDAIASIVLPGIGALIGGVIGEFAGDAIYDVLNDVTFGLLSKWFGGASGSYVSQGNVYSQTTGQLALLNYGSKDAANETPGAITGVINLSVAYENTINALLDTVNGRLDTTGYTVDDTNDGYYGDAESHSSFLYDTKRRDGYNVSLALKGGSSDVIQINNNPQLLVSIAVANEANQMKFSDGDLLEVRAIADWQATNPSIDSNGISDADNGTNLTGATLATLNDYMQVASDYRNYLNNTAAINSLIAADPSSAFSAGWIATLLQAQALGLNNAYNVGTGAGEDVSGNGANNTFWGGDGNDVFDTNNGMNIIYTYGGNDTINNIGGGTDVIYSGLGADTINGDAGNNTVNYSNSDAGVNVDLRLTTAQWGGFAQGDILINVQNIVGSNFGDTLIGNSGANIITGGSGNNTIEGGGGADTLNGGIGGINTISYAWATTTINVYLANGNTEGSGSDSTGSTLTNFQNVIASNYGGTITVGSGVHTLTGGAGNDTFVVDNLSAGSVIDGGGGYNIVMVNSADISQASLTNIQMIELASGSTLSVAQVTSNITISGSNYAVSDTAANIQANIDALETLVASGNVTSITLTNSATPSLTLTIAQLTSDSGVLNEIISPYTIIVCDSSANVMANISTLQIMASSGKLASIVLTDTTKPTITLTAAQLATDASVLSLVTSPYTVAIALSNGSVTLLSNLQVAITGNSDTIMGAAGSAGNNNVTITGTSNKIGLWNSVISLSTNASAYLISDALASHDSTGDTINIVAGDNLTLSGNAGATSNTVNATGSGDYLTLSGASEMITLNGSAITVTANGSGDTLILQSAGDYITFSASNGSVTANAIGDAVLLSGGNNTVTMNATSQTTAVTGNNDTVISTSNAATITLKGASDTGSLSGAGQITASGTGDCATLNSVNEAATLTGSTETATVNGNGDTLNVSGTGGDTLTLNGATDTVNLSGNSDNITLNGSKDTATIIGNNDVITVNGTGDTATATGADDTIITNSATASQLLLINPLSIISTETESWTGLNGTGTNTQNSIDWAAGGSQMQLFTYSPATIVDNAIGYSGKDGTGSQINTQTTTTQVSNGAITASITGTGDTTILANAAITLAASTQATIFGNTNAITGSTGDAVTLMGTGDTISLTNDSIILASGATASVIGNTDSIMGATGSAGGNTIAVSGAGEQIGLWNSTINFAANATGTLTRDAQAAQDSAGDIIALTSGNAVTLSGNSGAVTNTITASGTGDYVIVSGASQSVTLSGNSVNYTAKGASDASIITGNSDSITVSGTGDTLAMSGTNDYATFSTSNSTVSQTGVGDGLTLTGNYDNVTMGATSQSLAVTGTNNIISASGNANTLTLAGSYNTLTCTGAATIKLTGANDAANLNGSNQAATLTGGSETAAVSGTNDAVTLTASGETATITGNNDTVTVNTSGDTVNVSGTNDKIITNGATTSQVLLVNPSSAISTEVENYSGLNGTGTDTQNVINWTAGGSQVQLFTGLATGVASKFVNYSGVAGTGSILSSQLTGTSSNNTLTSDGTANETLIGLGGYDTYGFGRGNGADIIQNGLSTNTGATGELDFGSGIATNQLWLMQVGNNLQIDIMGTHDQITISGWFSHSYSQLQEIKTADGSMLDTQLNQLVQAMATYSAAHAGFDPTAVMQAPADTTLQAAITAAWHH